MTWLALLIASLVHAADAPEISRSVGEEGGVVVLWPRVIPRSDGAVARAAAFVVQEEAKRLVAEIAAARPVDVRPEPERVCPQAGCKGVAVGAVVVHQREACVVVATVSLPGRSEQILVPWAGAVDLKQERVPFREPPESALTIRDFASCRELKAPMAEREEAVRAALKQALGLP